MRKKIKIVFIGSVLFSKHLLEMFNKLGFKYSKAFKLIKKNI